ncbi:MAG: porin, partial [Burkholderiaceae bacterium]|nr:porin [Burkholderiaceae bacterium]
MMFSSSSRAADTNLVSPEVSVTGHVEIGFSANANSPGNHINFGQLNTDYANRIQLNQILLIVEKKLNSNSSDWTFGYRIEPLVGSDARLTHVPRQFDSITNSRNQFDVLETKLLIHAPVFTESGVDLTVGQYLSPIGYESID